MKPLYAFLKKECLECLRSGKLAILIILFVLLGIMSPAIAKLTPWLMEMMAGSLAEAGMVITEIKVDALTSWTQFFKNIPMGFIAFVFIYCGVFTREYQSGTLVLMLTKGLSRFKVVLAKAAVMLLMWTLCCILCFGVTYGYNAYFWDNSIAKNLFFAVFAWWLFGVWVISLMVLFSAVFKNNSGVLLGVGATVFISYIAGVFPAVSEYTPINLMNASAALTNEIGAGSYTKAVIVAAVLSLICIAASIPIINRKRI